MAEEEHTTQEGPGTHDSGSGTGSTSPPGTQGAPQQSPQSQQSQQPSQQGPYGGQQQRYQQAPSQPMFSSGNIKKMLGLALVIGVIMMFVGALLVSTSGYIEVDDNDSRNLRRNLNATGLLLASIGIFVPAIAASYGFYSARDLSDQQKLLLTMIIGGSLIGLAILVNTIVAIY